MPKQSPARPKRVVIVGAGFAGLHRGARKLARLSPLAAPRSS